MKYGIPIAFAIQRNLPRSNGQKLFCRFNLLMLKTFNTHRLPLLALHHPIKSIPRYTRLFFNQLKTMSNEITHPTIKGKLYNPAITINTTTNTLLFQMAGSARSPTCGLVKL